MTSISVWYPADTNKDTHEIGRGAKGLSCVLTLTLAGYTHSDLLYHKLVSASRQGDVV
jgi:hypothetical protein